MSALVLICLLAKIFPESSLFSTISLILFSNLDALFSPFEAIRKGTVTQVSAMSFDVG